MKNQADKKRVEKEFNVRDWVYLRLKPYRQNTVVRRPSQKLAKQYFGPFPILERLGKVAYRLELPNGSRIHNVFHVSLLKEVRGDPRQIEVLWPNELTKPQGNEEPRRIISVRNMSKTGNSQAQVLVQWKGASEDDATWEDMKSFKERSRYVPMGRVMMRSVRNRASSKTRMDKRIKRETGRERE